jgi:transcriptional regulator with XRE-family HTH domain
LAFERGFKGTPRSPLAYTLRSSPTQMRQSRRRQQLLPAKLLAIRKFLKLGQLEMANILRSQVLSHSGQRYNLKPGRISEYENGRREPNLFVLIAYARLAEVHLESVADDHVIVKEFRKRLGKEGYFERSQ